MFVCPHGQPPTKRRRTEMSECPIRGVDGTLRIRRPSTERARAAPRSLRTWVPAARFGPPAAAIRPPSARARRPTEPPQTPRAPRLAPPELRRLRATRARSPSLPALRSRAGGRPTDGGGGAPAPGEPGAEVREGVACPRVRAAGRQGVRLRAPGARRARPEASAARPEASAARPGEDWACSEGNSARSERAPAREGGAWAAHPCGIAR